MDNFKRHVQVKTYVSEPLFEKIEFLRKQKEFEDGEYVSMSRFLLLILKKHLEESA